MAQADCNPLLERALHSVCILIVVIIASCRCRPGAACVRASSCPLHANQSAAAAHEAGAVLCAGQSRGARMPHSLRKPALPGPHRLPQVSGHPSHLPLLAPLGKHDCCSTTICRSQVRAARQYF